MSDLNIRLPSLPSRSSTGGDASLSSPVVFATLGDFRVIEARVTIPAFGLWHADLTIDREASIPSGILKLSIADLVLACVPFRDPVAWQGRTRLRVMGGSGGWRKEVKAKGYQLTGGVKLSIVLGDAARDVGEKITVFHDAVIGPHFERVKQPAQRILNWLVPDQWWMDPDGTTKVGERESKIITSTFSTISVDGATGRVVVATEHPADFVPGRTFPISSLAKKGTINAVTHTLGKDGLRTEILAA